MKYIRGFLMAWGNFSALPCPYHKWHEESRKAMLCMLPLVGLLCSIVMLTVWEFLNFTKTPSILTGVLLTVIYFLSTGFIHLDGFMDCSDAILSRRSEMSERQRILKASDVGAFAVICIVMMFLIFAASMITMAEGFSFWKGCFFIGVVMTSRSVAADAVLWKPAMKISQYASFEETETKATLDFIVLWSITVIPVSVVFFLLIGVGLSQSYENVAYVYSYIGAVVVTAGTAHVMGFKDRRNLGGMNGDIAGHMIVTSETAGVLAAAILVSWGGG